jgi:hypothetical protein
MPSEVWKAWMKFLFFLIVAMIFASPFLNQDSLDFYLALFLEIHSVL